jgi:hypothetical protein
VENMIGAGAMLKGFLTNARFISGPSASSVFTVSDR